jgi:PAS domain S-box-containing protein
MYAGVMQETGWERLFWLVFERSSNPVVLLDDEQQIIDLNDAALSLLGEDRGVIGTSMTDRITPEQRPSAASAWQAFLRSGEGSGTRALVRSNGSEVDVDFAARLAMIGGRRLAIYVALAGDGDSLPPPSGPDHELPLTNREREIVTLIALGSGTDQIAGQLHISPATVRTHVRNAMSKVGTHTRAELVAVVLTADETLHPSPLGRCQSSAAHRR